MENIVGDTDWNQVRAWIAAIGFLAAAMSIVIGVQNFKRQHEWQRRKAAEEALIHLVLGEFPDTLDRIILEFKWDIVNERRSFTVVLEDIEVEKKLDLEVLVRRTLRILEAVCIQIKHNVVDEQICFDYLASIVPQVFFHCEEFIREERKQRKDDRVFENLELYGRSWSDKRKCFNRTKTVSVNPKAPTG